MLIELKRYEKVVDFSWLLLNYLNVSAFFKTKIFDLKAEVNQRSLKYLRLGRPQGEFMALYHSDN